MTPLIANAGLPMLIPQIVLMAFAFLPVVLIEFALMRKSMAISFPKGFVDVGVANLYTTLIGVPIAWSAMLAMNIFMSGIYKYGTDSPVQMLITVTLQAAWLWPYKDHLFWMIPAASTILLIPCFFVSVLMESYVLTKRWPSQKRHEVFSSVLRANLWSYLFLLAGGSYWFFNRVL